MVLSIALGQLVRDIEDLTHMCQHHPLFFGEQKFVSLTADVEKFARRYGKTLMGRGESEVDFRHQPY